MSGTLQASVIKDSASATNNLNLDSSGNVGIGTSTPSSFGKFAVIAPSGNQISFGDSSASASNNGYLNYSGGSGALALNAYSTGGSTYQAFSTSNSGTNAERMRLDSSGNLLVGTTTANAKVTVVSTGSNAGVYSTSANNYSIYGQASGAYAIYGNQTGATFGAVFGIESTGKYGILGYQGLGLITNASINVNGTTYTSDARLKENVLPISNALTTIQALNPVSFNWKPNSSRGSGSSVPDFGLIAQEVEQIIPECVFETKTPPRTPEMSGPIYLEDELGSYKGVDYSRFIPFLIAALKEANDKLKAQEDRIIALEAK